MLPTRRQLHPDHARERVVALALDRTLSGEATAAQLDLREYRQAGQLLELASSAEPWCDPLAAERGEHGDEQGRDEGEKGVSKRARRIRRRGRFRRLGQLKLRAGIGLADTQLAQPLPNQRDLPSRAGRAAKPCHRVDKSGTRRLHTAKLKAALAGEEGVCNGVGDPRRIARAGSGGANANDVRRGVDRSVDLPRKRVGGLARQAARRGREDASRREQGLDRRQPSFGVGRRRDLRALVEQDRCFRRVRLRQDE